MEDPFNAQIEAQPKAAIEECRKCLRGWDAEQREMVLWILEEEVRHDKLMDFTHEDGNKTEPEKLT